MRYTPNYRLLQPINISEIGHQTIKGIRISDSLIHGRRHILFRYDTFDYARVAEYEIESIPHPVEIDVPNKYNVGDKVCVFFKGVYYELPIVSVYAYVGRDTIEWCYSFEVSNNVPLIQGVPECCIKWHKEDFKADDFADIYIALKLEHNGTR